MKSITRSKCIFLILALSCFSLASHAGAPSKGTYYCSTSYPPIDWDSLDSLTTSEMLENLIKHDIDPRKPLILGATTSLPDGRGGIICDHPRAGVLRADHLLIDCNDPSNTSENESIKEYLVIKSTDKGRVEVQEVRTSSDKDKSPISSIRPPGKSTELPGGLIRRKISCISESELVALLEKKGCPAKAILTQLGTAQAALCDARKVDNKIFFMGDEEKCTRNGTIVARCELEKCNSANTIKNEAQKLLNVCQTYEAATAVQGGQQRANTAIIKAASQPKTGASQ